MAIVAGCVTLSATAVEPKKAVFTFEVDKGQDPSVHLLQKYIEAELTLLNQNVTAVSSKANRPSPTAEELLLIDIDRDTTNHPTTVRLVQQSSQRLLHSEVILLPNRVLTESDQIKFSGAKIARQLVRRLDQLNFDARLPEQATWMGEPHSVNWHFEKIDQCRQDYLINAAEDGFPGTINIYLKKSPTRNYSVYRYTGRASLQRQAQWLRTLFRFEGLAPNTFKILVSDNEIRILFDNAYAVNPYICGE